MAAQLIQHWRVGVDCGVGDYYGRGDCYRHQGKLDEAMAEYSQALQLDPKFAGACWGRGDCLLAQVSTSIVYTRASSQLTTYGLSICHANRRYRATSTQG